MRIAILLSGRINGYEKSYKNIIDNIVQGNQVDFFISYCKDISEESFENFKKIFNPVSYVKSDEVYFDMTPYPHPTHLGVKSRHNMMCMYLNRRNVYKIYNEYKIKNNIHYDLVFSYRVDFIFHSKLDLSLLLNAKESICIPEGCDYNGINDRMAVGNEETMKEYLLCYDSLQLLFDQGGTPHPETILKEYIEYKKLKIYRFHIGYSFV